MWSVFALKNKDLIPKELINVLRENRYQVKNRWVAPWAYFLLLKVMEEE